MPAYGVCKQPAVLHLTQRLHRMYYWNPSTEYIEMTEGEGLRFYEPVMVKRSTIEEGYIALEHSGLGIYAAGQTLALAKAAFWEDVAFLWRTYAQEADENLTKDAQQRKQKLLCELMEVSRAYGDD